MVHFIHATAIGQNEEFMIPLDTMQRVNVLYTLYTAFYLAKMEKYIMTLIRARFVPGLEPWLIWDRALRRYNVTKGEHGMQDWQDLGSVRYE